MVSYSALAGEEEIYFWSFSLVKELVPWGPSTEDGLLLDSALGECFDLSSSVISKMETQVLFKLNLFL